MSCGGAAGERLWVFAAHGPAVPGIDAGALPNVGLSSGEGVQVAQSSASLREGDMSLGTEPGINGREWCGGGDIADDEQDVHWKGEQSRRGGHPGFGW